MVDQLGQWVVGIPRNQVYCGTGTSGRTLWETQECAWQDLHQTCDKWGFGKSWFVAFSFA